MSDDCPLEKVPALLPFDAGGCISALGAHLTLEQLDPPCTLEQMKTGDFISHHRGQIMRTLVDPEASVFNARASTDELSSFLFDGWQWIGRFGETDALGRPADVGGRRKTRRGGKGSMGRGGGHRAGGDARKRRRLSIARAASASGGAENAGAE